jgi:hypothetical protein
MIGNPIGRSPGNTLLNLINYSLTVDGTTFTFTGQAVTIRRGRPIVVGTTSFTFTGQPVTLTRRRPIVVGTTSFSFTGQAVTLRRPRTVVVGGTSWTFTGQDVTLRRTRPLVAAGTSFTFTGQAVTLKHGYVITVQAGSFTFSGSAVTLTALQHQYPESDISIGSWTDQAGGTTNLYSVVDEPLTPNDSDYVKSPDMSAGSSELVLGFGTMSTPGVDTGHTLRVRYRKVNVDGGTELNFNFALLQGTTVIAEQNVPDVGTSWVTGELNLSTTEAAAITNYNDLRVRLTAEGPAAAAAFPVMESSAASLDSSYSGGSGTKTFTLPSGITSGDLLVAVIYAAEAGPTITKSGWTATAASPSSNGNARCTVLYKEADGSESGTIAFDFSNMATHAGACIYRISGQHDSSAPESAFNTTIKDPPSLTASWGAEKNLWLANSFDNGGDGSYSAAPSGYSGFISFNGTESSSVEADGAGAWIESEADTENPGAFTATVVADNPINATVVIRPGAGGSTTTTVTAPNGQSWTLQGTVENGTYVNGDVWVNAGGGTVRVLSVSTSPDGSGSTARNGGMINPSFNTFVESSPMGNTVSTSFKQGFDGRATVSGVMDYDDSYNAHLDIPALDLSPGDSLVSCVSFMPELNKASLDSHWGSNSQAISRMAVLTVVGSTPTTGSFRPNYFGTTKISKTWGDVNTALMPDLALSDPKSTSSDGFHLDSGSVYVGSSSDPTHRTSTDEMNINALRDVQWYVYPMHGGFCVSYLSPLFNMFWYPEQRGMSYGQIANYVMGDFTDRDDFLKRIIQVAIDAYAIVEGDGFTGSSPFGGGAGFPFSPLWFIRFAGLLFDDTDFKDAKNTGTGHTDYDSNTIYKWGEQNRCYYSASAHSQYNTHLPAEITGDTPLYGDPPYGDVSGGQSSNGTIRDPDGVYDMFPYEDRPSSPSTRYTEWKKTGPADDPNIGSYMTMSRAAMGAVLASYCMGDEAFWPGAIKDFALRHAADPQMWGGGFNTNFDYTDAFTAPKEFYRDIYGMGGTGNGWITDLWDSEVGVP